MEALRRQVFARDSYQCRHEIRHPITDLKGYVVDSYYKQCGNFVTWETGHLAHIKSRGAGGPDTAENTYCCCAEHHMMFHQRGPSMKKICPPKDKL